MEDDFHSPSNSPGQVSRDSSRHSIDHDLISSLPPNLASVAESPLSPTDTRRWSNLMPSNMSFGRRKAAAELLATEDNYVTDLTHLLTGYRDELCRENLLTPEEDLAIFINLPDILAFHTTLLAELQQQATTSPWTAAEVFFRNADTMIELYSTYCSLHPKSLQSLDHRMADPRFEQYVKLCQQRLKLQLSLKDDLLKPVQRIMRYQLLLKEQCKQAKPSEEGVSTLERACHAMKTVTERINADARQFHMTRLTHGDTMLARTPPLAERLSALPCDFSKLGKLVDEFSDVLFSIDGSKAKSKGGSSRYLLLFSDGLVSCKSREGTSLSVKEFYDFGRDFHCTFPDNRSLMITDQAGDADGPTYFLRNVNVIERLGWLLELSSQSPAVTSPTAKKGRTFNQLTGRDRINSAQKGEKKHLPRSNTLTVKAGDGSTPETSPKLRPRMVTVNGRHASPQKVKQRYSLLLGKPAGESLVDGKEGEVDWITNQRELQQALSELGAENARLEEELDRVVTEMAQLKIDTIQAVAPPPSDPRLPTKVPYVDALNMALEAEYKRVTMLTSQLSVTQGREETLRNEKSALAMQLDELVRERDTLQTNLTSTNLSLEETQTQLQDEQQARAGMEAELIKARQEIRQLKDMANDHTAELSKRDSKLQELQQGSKQLEAQIDKLKADKVKADEEYVRTLEALKAEADALLRSESQNVTQSPPSTPSSRRSKSLKSKSWRGRKSGRRRANAMTEGSNQASPSDDGMTIPEDAPGDNGQPCVVM
eukprot:TRINITY_DN10059_c0_g1_i1.p1 TRINITY_DN10059_c0_g1~~TRINITY_DN10059_c0_g1_i1.p1  ORF type:complete len:769 (+),score=229.01 TRINITY_DN10059_c0_g1_i1:120-2426(+)